MDFENLVNFSTDYLSEYLWAFSETLRNPTLRFQPLLASKDNKLTTTIPSEPRVNSGPYLNPKLLIFVLISIFIGSTINGLVPGRKVGPDIETTIVSIFGIWFIYGSFIHLACKLLQGKGNYIQTMSVCLQIFAVLHVVSSFAALIFASIDAYFLVQFLLMAVYLPMAIKNIHSFGWLRQIIIVMLPIIIVIIGLSLYQNNGVLMSKPPR